MWILTPLYGVFFGFIFLTGLLIGYLWIGKLIPTRSWVIYLISSFRAVLFSIFTYYAYLLLDSFVKIVGFEILGYENIWFHATGLILMLLLATVFLFIGVFNAPTIQTLVTFVCILGYCIYYFEFYLPTINIGEKDVLIREPFTVIVILMGTNLVSLPLRCFQYKKYSSLEFHKVWDISEKVKKIINFKSIFVLWIFFAIESILQLEGLSILYWIGML